MLLTGGPCTVGPGQVVDENIEETIRSISCIWKQHTIDTEAKAKRNNMISSVITLRSLPPFTGVFTGHGPESAPRSAFRAVLGTCFGVPQRVLFECFWRFLGPKNAKKHSKIRNTPSTARNPMTGINQGRILAVWILAAKLPNSDLKIAVDFWVDFFLLFFPRKKAQNNPPQIIHGKIHPGIRSEKFPSDFCRSLLLTH